MGGKQIRELLLGHYREAERRSAEDAGSSIDMYTRALAGDTVLLGYS